MNYIFNVLGSRGSHSIYGKNFEIYGGQTSCYCIFSDDYCLLIDCGTGLYDAKSILKNFNHIDILLTHVHYDHIVGLLDNEAFPDNVEITFYGNFNKWFNKNNLDDFYKAPFWPSNNLNANYINYEDKLVLNNDIEIQIIPSNHPNDSNVFVLNLNNKKIGFFSDFEYNNNINLDILKNADTLFYDGMYDVDDYKNHIGWGHSTWKIGSELANKYNIKNLYIIHHNPNYDDNKIKNMEKECIKEFNNSYFVKPGDKFTF